MWNGSEVMPMKLEDQVPDRELCELLKKLGMPQDKAYCWLAFDQGWELVQYIPSKLFPNSRIAAPTIAELGEMLPARVFGPKGTDYLRMTKDFADVWTAWYEGYDTSSHEGISEAIARARLLIWCAENGHVKWSCE